MRRLHLRRIDAQRAACRQPPPRMHLLEARPSWMNPYSCIARCARTHPTMRFARRSKSRDQRCASSHAVAYSVRIRRILQGGRGGICPSTRLRLHLALRIRDLTNLPRSNLPLRATVLGHPQVDLTAPRPTSRERVLTRRRHLEGGGGRGGGVKGG